MDAGRILFASEAHVETDIDELGLDDTDQYLDLVYDCLQLAASDPIGSYRPSRHPHSTRHAASAGLRMWPFVVRHPELGKELYFKFCLRPDAQGAFYIHIDCHETRF